MPTAVPAEYRPLVEEFLRALVLDDSYVLDIANNAAAMIERRERPRRPRPWRKDDGPAE